MTNAETARDRGDSNRPGSDSDSGSAPDKGSGSGSGKTRISGGMELPAEAVEREPRHRVAAGALLTAGMAAALVAAFVHLPREHDPLPQVARQALEVALPGWKLLEPVNEVVYGTRGFDTFGETFLLLAAVMSVVVLSRSREQRRGYFGEDVAGLREQSRIDPDEKADRTEQEARSAERAEGDDEDEGGTREGGRRRPHVPDGERLGTPAPEQAEAMSVVVRGAIRTATPILAVTGCYLVAWGYSPGGGFPGGAVILGVVMLVYAAFGRARIKSVVRPGLVETIELAGAALIVMTESLGLILKGSFSANWLPLEPPGTIRSGGVAQLFSAGELVEVGTGLTIAVFALLAMGHDWSPDEAQDGDLDDGDSDDGGSGGGDSRNGDSDDGHAQADGSGGERDGGSDSADAQTAGSKEAQPT